MGNWSDQHLPRPKGPTVSEHMERILARAKAQKAKNYEDIAAAVSACSDGACLLPGGGRGKPPAHDKHAFSVLNAVRESERTRWEECLGHLRHGEQAEEGRRQKA